MSERRALVTGATGFTGARLVAMLQAEGWRVCVLTRADSQDASAVTSCFDAARPHAVFSLAVSRLAASPQQVADLIDANVRLPMLLAAASARSGECVFINTTSYTATALGGQAPRSLLAASKQSVEPVLAWAHAQLGMSYATLSPTSIYGPNDPRVKVVPALLRAALAGSPIAMADRARTIDLVHVDDVARAYVQAAEGLVEGAIIAGSTFDVQSGDPVRLDALVAEVEAASGRRVDTRWETRPTAEAVADVVATRTPNLIPGWTATIYRRAGLRQALDSMNPSSNPER